MGRSSPQGLTASDFHHQPFVNPRDVFPTKSRVAGRSQNYRSPIRQPASARTPSRFSPDPYKFACCDDDDDEDISSFRASNAPNCCITHDDPTEGYVGFPDSSGSSADGCSELPHHSSPSPMDCEDCVDDCEDCVEEHLKANHLPQNYDEDCEECIEENDVKCPKGKACQDTCDECDFSCFDCIDWNDFERDKSLGLSFSVPLLDGNGFTQPFPLQDDSEALNFQGLDMPNLQPESTAPPLDVPMHHQCFGNTVPYWNNIAQDQLCTGNPGISQQLPLPPFGPEFGCHPATAHQASLAGFRTEQPLFISPTLNQQQKQIHRIEIPKEPLDNTEDLLSAVTAPATSRACQWIMPCGTVCGASFATGTDLKKHIKAIHLVKGVTKCQWQECESANFASEAALTGHISKKHLAPLLTTPTSSSSTSSTNRAHHTTHTHEGPFKCTFPGCPKSFMYKQVRDEHVASCHNGNKMYCPICHTYLNGEGSNFKRHMATHRPKHQHMLCKFHALGCKRRFPRVDNLRRHEACCKFGKRAKELVNAVGDGMSRVDVDVDVDIDGATPHHHHHHAHHHVHNSGAANV